MGYFKNCLRKAIRPIFILIILPAVFLLINPSPIKAQTLDYDCIGEGLTEYMNTVINIAGDLEHIKLLSPAFNMSTSHTPPIIEAMNTYDANWSGLDGIAGNAYNHDFPITYWVDGVMSYFPGMPVMITETGYITGTFEEFLDELSNFSDGHHNGVRYIGATLFNAFGTNPDPRWSSFVFNNEELSQICSGSCGIIGVNSAAGYRQPDDFYIRAQGFGMRRTLEIFTSEENTTSGVQAALTRGINPIIRLGTADSSGPSAEAYANYLVRLDQQVTGDVYAIAGPNEPDLEFWATPDCEVSGGGGDPFGALPNPRPTPFACNEVSYLSEFHSLRPYQASPCNQNYEDLALFCGNDFMMSDTIVIEKVYYDDPGQGSFQPSDPPYPISWSFLFDENECAPNYDANPPMCGGGEICDAIVCIPDSDPDIHTETCEFTIDRTVPISINLDGAELPIMGYTEPSEETWDTYEVINLVNYDDTLEDPEKVNEYVSWYLNGVIGRAEYGRPSEDQLVNFSGPLKRLLSFESQLVRRYQEVERAGVTRHDQKVEGDTRLSYWANNPPPLRIESDTFDEYLETFDDWWDHSQGRIFSYIPFSSTEDRKGMVNLSSYSLQPLSPEDTCIICAYITDQTPATLFFSHMEEGAQLADLLQQIHSPEDADLNEDPLNVQKIDYSMCEIAEVRKNPGDNLFPTGLTATIEYTADILCHDLFVHGEGRLCEELPGDTRCYQGTQADYVCDTYYDQVDCDGGFCGIDCERYYAPPSVGCGINPDYYSCFHESWSFLNPCICDPMNPTQNCLPTQDEVCTSIGSDWICGYRDCIQAPSPPNPEISSWGSYDAGTCTNDIYVSFKTQTLTPLATEVWSKLVSGPYGAFRRIFPQIEDAEGRPIRRLWDIPAETDVQFNVQPPFSLVGGSQHQIYFPHIGGVHEYFLNCLQKTLRPQGYGEGCISAPEFPPSSPPGSDPTYWCPTPPVPPGAGDCSISFGCVTFAIINFQVYIINNCDQDCAHSQITWNGMTCGPLGGWNTCWAGQTCGPYCIEYGPATSVHIFTSGDCVEGGPSGDLYCPEGGS